MMSEKIEQPDEWSACPQGALVEMVQAQRSQRQRTAIVRFTSTAIVLLAVGAGALFATRSTPDNRGHLVGGIYCSECVEQMADYSAQRLDALPATHVRDHLAGCGKCREKYEQMGSEARLDQRREAEPGYLAYFQAAPPRALASGR